MGRPQADIDAVLRSACRLRVKTWSYRPSTCATASPRTANVVL